MLRLALRNLMRQRARTALTLGAIVLGVATIVLSGGFVDDLLVQLREATIHSRLGHLQIYRDGHLAQGGRRPLELLIERPADVERAIATLDGVDAVSSRLDFSGVLTKGRGSLAILGEGVQPQAEARIGSAVAAIAGRRLGASDRFAASVGEGLAAALDIKPGDRVNLTLSTAEGAMNALDFTVAGVFRSPSKEFDARAVVVPLAAAQELAGTSGAGSVVVLLRDTERTDAARRTLETRLPPGLEVRGWQDLAEFYNSTAALYRRQFAILQLIIVVTVVLAVANSVNMTLHERTPEFGIMRALGNSAGYVFRLAVLETALLGGIGALAGVAAGSVIALLVSAIGIPMPPPPNSESGYTAIIRIVPMNLAIAFAVGALASLCAAILPALHIARLPVVEALRRGI
jgi:putative ABC transport system permease protein